jgi:hypothetical protein
MSTIYKWYRSYKLEAHSTHLEQHLEVEFGVIGIYHLCWLAYKLGDSNKYSWVPPTTKNVK